MAETADAIIIGAGVIGAATAYEMAKAGYKTLTLDRNKVAGHGSTSGSCAIIRVHYSTLEGTAFAYEGYHYWRDWADYLEAPASAELAKFLETGCLVMRTDQNAMMESHMAHCNALHIPYEVWSAEAVMRRLPVYEMKRYWPAKRMDDTGFGEPTGGTVSGGVFFPTAGYVTDPALSAQNLMDAAIRHGARARYGARVTAILQENGAAAGVALEDGREIHAPIVVNVAGPASAKINGMAGVLDEMTISTRALKQEVTHVPSPPGFNFERDGFVVSDSDIACYCRPEHGGNILVGSEDPECDPKVWVEDDEDYDRSFTEQWTHQAQRYAQRVPTLGVPGQAKGVVDLYDVSDDWIPIYDASSLKGYYMACGSSGNQYKNAPIAGKMMTALVDYCENGGDHDATPLVFHLPYIDRPLNVGFFSRKRAINKDSSFSVLG
ncbi:MAG: FAD-dependent oxidoreductase [Alphaproteobacteria bacterium]|nr:FAD-dependent oxidoreductase [Alphaproteobacteria bacterium]